MPDFKRFSDTEKVHRNFIKITVDLCEDKTIEMFLRFRCLDLNTQRGWKISIIWWHTLHDLSPLVETDADEANYGNNEKDVSVHAKCVISLSSGNGGTVRGAGSYSYGSTVSIIG